MVIDDTWLRAYGLTQLIEAPIYFFVLREFSRLRTAPRAFVSVLPSALTHPLLWFVLFPWAWQSYGYWPAAAIGESVVWFVEALVIASLVDRGRRSALTVGMAASLLANGASFGTGLLLDRLDLL